MPAHVQFDLASAIFGEIPGMRAYARLMTNDRSEADRAVEETLKSIVANDIRWCEASRVRIPLIKILRSKILRGFLARDRRPDLPQGVPGVHGTIRSSFAGIGRAKNEGQTVTNVGSALLKLSIADRETIILSEAAGFSDLEIAEICGCAPETVNGSVNRGRAQLAELLGMEFVEGRNPGTVPAAAVEVADSNVMTAVR